MTALPTLPRFARFAWAVLGYEVAVVVWGAYVRASGSGAGCGQHWPLCNGEVIPRSPRIETLVELSHRITSGIALALTLAMLGWAWLAYPRRHIVRSGAATTAGLMLGEALIGAGLVLFRLVARDESMARAFSICLHLCNTFLLLGSTALTAWWASGGPRVRLQGQRASAVAAGFVLLALVIVGASGAVTALGDTLFPASSLVAGFAQDFAPGAHPFVKLRTLHPVLAVSAGTLVVIAGGMARALRPSRVVGLLSRLASVLVLLQVGAGLLDVLMLAPVGIQLAHLLFADALWIVTVLTAAAALGVNPQPARDDEAAEAVTAGP